MTETASISTDSQHEHKVFVGLDDRIYIESVDGRSTKASMFTTASAVFPETVYVLPGQHKLELLWGNGFYRANGRLTVPTESNHSYVIRQVVRDKKVFLWAEDAATGKSVTGTAVDASGLN
jgi:hypothetical protein